MGYISVSHARSAYWCIITRSSMKNPLYYTQSLTPILVKVRSTIIPINERCNSRAYSPPRVSCTPPRPEWRYLLCSFTG